VSDSSPVADSLWPATVVGALLDRLRAAPARAGNTRVLAIDGPSGSGKTTLSAALQAASEQAASEQAASGDFLQVVHMDDLYPGWDGLAESVPKLVEWVLVPLADGAPARYRRYDWHANEYAEWHQLPPAGLLVIEGAGAGSLPCAPYLSLLVYLDAPEALRYRRGMARDGDGYRPYWKRWAEQERRHFAEHHPSDRADVVLDAQSTQVPGVP
jgi:cytidylate kinase